MFEKAPLSLFGNTLSDVFKITKILVNYFLKNGESNEGENHVVLMRRNWRKILKFGATLFKLPAKLKLQKFKINGRNSEFSKTQII